MREYELTVVYDLAVAEQSGPDASVKLLSAAVEARGGKVNKIDHWGRRRLAYPIGRAIDGDYIITRVDLEPTAISPLEEAFRIDERVYRHLVVRADELPAAPVPREPRRMPNAPEAAAPPAVPEPAAAAPAPPEPAAASQAAPEAAAETAAPEAVAEAVAPESAAEAPADTEPTA